MSTYKLRTGIFRKYPNFLKKSEEIRVDDRDENRKNWCEKKGPFFRIMRRSGTGALSEWSFQTRILVRLMSGPLK